MQEFLNIKNPCAGGTMTGTVHHSGPDLQLMDFLRIGIECKIAVRLGAGLVAGEAPHTHENVTYAIGACMSAPEIVDNR